MLTSEPIKLLIEAFAARRCCRGLSARWLSVWLLAWTVWVVRCQYRCRCVSLVPFVAPTLDHPQMEARYLAQVGPA